jgi:hypothetical protein
MRLMLMRPFILAFAVLAASANPAPAQVDPLRAGREAEMTAQQQMQFQRSIALENQLNALDARVVTEQRLRDMEAQRDYARQLVPSDPNRTAAPDVAGYASIPDASLAASNARIREVTQPRR